MMSADFSSAELHTAGPQLEAIDNLLAEFAELAKSAETASLFYAELLERTVGVMAAIGGIVWLSQRDGELQIASHVNPEQTGLADGQRPPHRNLLAQVLRQGAIRLIAPRPGAGGQSPENPTDKLLMLAPVVLDREPRAVVEIVQRPDVTSAAQRGYVHFIEAVAQIAVDFHRAADLRELRRRDRRSGDLIRFSRQVHGYLNLKTKCYAIANDGRLLIGCDRLSVVVRRGSKTRLAAISGVDRFDRRAVSVRLLERLAHAALVSGEPLWYSDGGGDFPPEVEQALVAYLDEAHARCLAVVPLYAPATGDPAKSTIKEACVVGALVVEQFDAGLDDEMRARAEGAGDVAGTALCSALEYESLPLRSVSRLLRSAGQGLRFDRLPKTVAAIMAIAAIVIALATVPADFEIEARGQLQPRIRRDVFSPADGVVGRMVVDEGDGVLEGQVLLEMRRPELDLEFGRVGGEIQTAQKMLSAVQAGRIESRLADGAARARYQELSSEEEALKQKLANLEAQTTILKRQRDELSVRSPMHGQLLTWNARELLETRPVKRGQRLLRVADLGGPWVLEIEVPDGRVGHVLAAQQSRGNDLAVRFLLATQPATQYQGKIAKRALRTETRDDEEPFVKFTVVFDRLQVRAAELRPGATATAKIDCGRRSIGYVWLHELWEVVETRLLF